MSDVSEIKPDDRVRVPKGTTVYRSDTGEPLTATRDQVVTVKAIRHANCLIRRLLPPDALQSYRKETSGYGYNPGRDEDIADSYLEAVLGGKRHRVVEWTGKLALIDDVVPANDAPVPVRKVTKLHQMVVGSRWQVTADAEIVCETGNPAWWEARNAFQRGGGHEAWRQAPLHADSLHPRTIIRVLGRIEAGTILEVSGKKTTGLLVEGNIYAETQGTLVPFKVVSGSYQPLLKLKGWGPSHGVHLSYASLEPIVEAIEIPQVRVYAIRDRETGTYFSHTDAYARDNRLAMVPKFAKAKKYPDLGKLKLAILDWTGYYQGLISDRPDWMGDGRKIADFPESFEAVCFDKLAKAELETYDLQAWFAKTWTLRTLTVTHGSVVRKLYADLDKKGEVETFSYVLTARGGEDRHGYARELSAEEIAGFETGIGQTVADSGLKRTDVRRTKDAYSIATAFRDADAAFMAMLAYDGALEVAVLNMSTLCQEVRDQKSD